MVSYLIDGPARLMGEIKAQGAKNSTLPLLAASLLVKGESVFFGCPVLRDVAVSVKILENLGAVCCFEGNTLRTDTSFITGNTIPNLLMRRMRSSIVFLGAILSRTGEAKISFPGGCEIGARPIDLHISALKKLGAEIREEGGDIFCTAPKGLKGADISLSFPSVGATENIILASVVSQGTTIIRNAAREPEITELASYLNLAGASIKGAGDSLIIIEGARELHGCEYSIMPDRIVAATYLAATAATGGEIAISGFKPEYIDTVTAVLEEAGCRIKSGNDYVSLKAPQKLKTSLYVRTMPYPGFPTDAQAPFMAMAAGGYGTSVFVENIFENRFKHAGELMRMGARIKTEGRVAVVEGRGRLSGTSVEASDLRGGAALIIAGLAAEGRTVIDGGCYIERGYEEIEKNLSLLGAEIQRLDIMKGN